MNVDNSASAGEGGSGAPPETNQANRAPSDLTREYSGSAIRVQWYAGRCIHSAACIRALPRVFDPKRRPWVDLRDANPDDVAAAVLQCPTGALHFVRTDGGPPEPDDEPPSVRAIRNGPYFLRGPIEIRGNDGEVIRRDTRVALCRCGQSKHMPFCDNTHREIGWRSQRPEESL